MNKASLLALLVLGCSESAPPTVSADGSNGGSGGSETWMGATGATGGQLSSSGGAPSGGSGTSPGGETSSGGAPSEVEGSTSCARGDYVFCDDFEGASLAAAWVVNENSDSSVSLATDVVRGGTRAVHLTMHAPDTGGSGASLTVSSAFPQLADHYFGRMYFRIDALPSAGVHVDYLTGSGPLAGGSDANYSFGLSGSRLMANYFVFSPWQDHWKNSAEEMPTNRWVCIEWEFDRLSDTLCQWLDGRPIEDQTVIGESPEVPGKAWRAPSFARQRIGYVYYQTSSTKNFNVWLDEVVLDESRIGCLPE